jgi:hypothetical protein
MGRSRTDPVLLKTPAVTPRERIRGKVSERWRKREEERGRGGEWGKVRERWRERAE